MQTAFIRISHEDSDPHTPPRELLPRRTMKWSGGGNGGGPSGGQGMIL